MFVKETIQHTCIAAADTFTTAATVYAQQYTNIDDTGSLYLGTNLFLPVRLWLYV